MKYLMTVCIIFFCVFLSGCKPPRISISGNSGKLGTGYSHETINGKGYCVLNDYFCPAYYDGEDWGIVVLAVADITDRETEFTPYRITSTDRHSQSVDLLIVGKNVTCQYEKNFVVVCYNDESGNCYRTRLEMNDPKIACLFYSSDDKNRKEIVDLWHQLNKEKHDHSIVFEAQ